MDDENELTRITVYTVKTNTDLTEGRGREYIKHYCRLRSTAYRLAENNYVQGTDCPVSTATLIDLGDGRYVDPAASVQIEEPTADDRQREQVMARYEAVIARAKQAGLSDAEIEILKKGI